MVGSGTSSLDFDEGCSSPSSVKSIGAEALALERLGGIVLDGNEASKAEC